MFTLHNGDCLQVMPSIPSGSIDAIITDLPYGTTACAWDEVIPFADMWKEVKRILKPSGVFITTASQPFTSALIMSNPSFFKYEIIWDKDRSSGSMLARKRPLKYHENVLIFFDGQATYNPQMTKGSMQEKASGGKTDLYGDVPVVRYKSNLYYPRSIQKFTACHNMTGKDHPTQKPVSLFAYLVRTYTNPSEVVLDITMGIGTTGVSCIEEGRNFIGIEKEIKYFSIAENRIKSAVLSPSFLTPSNNRLQPTASGVGTQASFPLLGGSQAEESSATNGGG